MFCMQSHSLSRALATHVTARLSSGRAARSSRKSQLVIFCSGRLLCCPDIQYGHKQLGMARTATSSLVPFQPFQPGRNNLRHALIHPRDVLFLSKVIGACFCGHGLNRSRRRVKLRTATNARYQFVTAPCQEISTPGDETCRL